MNNIQYLLENALSNRLYSNCVLTAYLTSKYGIPMLNLSNVCPSHTAHILVPVTHPLLESPLLSECFDSNSDLDLSAVVLSHVPI